MSSTPHIVHLPLGDDPPTARLFYGRHVVDVLQGLPPASVHVICTSPPYWGLRDYGVEPQAWPEVHFRPMVGLPEIMVQAHEVALGLEPDPLHYVAHLVHVFREARRVLRGDGTLWLNLGDSYCGTGGAGGSGADLMGDQRPEEVDPEKHGKWNREWGDLKPKDLLLMPHRIAMALQADGWWVRSDIVWAKGSVMPESIRDRPTRSHESVFLLAKSRHYFYDCDAIREPISTQPQGRETNEAASDEGRPDHRKSSMSYRYDGVPPGNPSGRNKRTVWNINPRPYPGAHFACWPPELVEVMVKAGSSEHGVCGVCGAPWARQVAREERPITKEAVQPNQRDGELHAEHGIERTGLTHFRYNQWLQANPAVTVGWEPTCDHVDASINRAIVLDPFSGSATTGMVALQLGRDYVGIDLQVSYLKLAEARIQGLKPPGEAVEAEAGDIFDLFGGP